MELVKTCGGCPEQYVQNNMMYLEKVKKIGYLRLRHGWFTAQVYGTFGETVYESATLGDGSFYDHERDMHLNRAKEAIKKYLKDKGEWK